MKKSALGFIIPLILITLTSCSGSKYKKDKHLAIQDGKPVVERYGWLQVKGIDLCDQNGNPVQLRGMSSHGLQWHGKYANEKIITFLRDDWNSQLWRSAMYLSSGGYIQNPSLKLKVIDSVEGAINAGVYVIVDWHVLQDKDPLLYINQAKEFFEEMSSKYANVPNVIYEICNEPNGEEVTWNENIKPYAEQIIPIIRKNSPKSIIIVGTPHWSSDLRSAWQNPLTNVENVMYTYHFYAGSTQENGRKTVTEARENGLPVFVTEWGVTKDSGDGGVFEKETLDWIKFLRDNNVSWANWSVNNKGEDSGVLNYNADKNAEGNWQEKDLSPAGKLLRKILRNEVKLK